MHLMATIKPSILGSAGGQRLRREFAGQLVQPEDSDYERARVVWNGIIDKHPALVARCTTAGDVVAAIRFAREEGHVLAVRGGGHSFAGFSSCDAGIVIDLSRMSAVRIDPDSRIAAVQGGATWGAFDAAAGSYGLATTGGLVSTTGVAGLTLGGGIGWLMRKHGLSCDNLLAVELVSAQGDSIRASADQNPELFWALRGGGGNFGIVTSFEFRLHEVGTVTGGLMLFPEERTPEILAFYQDYVQDLPDEFTTMLSAITAPVADFVPTEMRGRPSIAFIGCFSGDAREANRVLQRVRRLHPGIDLFDSVPYVDLQKMFDADMPHGIRCYLKAGYLSELNESATEVVVKHTRPMRSAQSTFDLHHMGGAVARVAEDATAFDDRRSTFCFNVVGLWTDPTADDSIRDSVREFASALAPFSTRTVYVNFTADAGSARVAYSEAKLSRLQQVKRGYDPNNLFRLNQNIQT
jgi:hypothetical protein